MSYPIPNPTIEWPEAGITVVYRPLDTLATFETAAAGATTAPARYAVRQVLDQEYQKYVLQQLAEARQARSLGRDGLSLAVEGGDKENHVVGSDRKRPKAAGAKRDFFGRIINEAQPTVVDASETDAGAVKRTKTVTKNDGGGNNVWVTFHEGFSNAVRKPITLEELMRGI